MIKNKFLPLKFIKKHNCFFCHNIKNTKNILPSFSRISKLYFNNYNNKKYLFKIIKYGSKNIFNKNLIMPAFTNIKKKYIYYLIKWFINFK